MLICPECGKLISDKKYARHLKRRGTTHEHPPLPLVEHGASADVYRGRIDLHGFNRLGHGWV